MDGALLNQAKKLSTTVKWNFFKEKERREEEKEEKKLIPKPWENIGKNSPKFVASEIHFPVYLLMLGSIFRSAMYCKKCVHLFFAK